MMVVHEDSDSPMELGVIRKPLYEQKSYVIVKNHVRELVNNGESASSTNENTEKSSQKLENLEESKHKSDKMKKAVTTTNERDTINSQPKIAKSDLEELKSVYLKCKEVMRKIQSKYGHLLDLESEAETSTSKKRKQHPEENSESECDCKVNKKIVFDDDGKQSTVEAVTEKHICVKKVKYAQHIKTGSKNIDIEYTDNEIVLSESLQDLGSMLQDPDVPQPIRNKIIDKIKVIRQEYTNEIKFNKHVLIEKLKTNSDEVLAFKGTNLSAIPGYL